MLRFLTAGESHGPAEVAILEGMPAELSLTYKDINRELKKRHSDYGRGGRAKIEKDEVEILSGIRFGKTLGGPIALLIRNEDFKNWSEKMSIEENDSADNRTIKVTKPRPGHADLAGVIKYGFDDIRNVLERASARETVMRVAVGAICKRFLDEFKIKIASHTISIGKVIITKTDYSFDDVNSIFEVDPDVHCVDGKTREKMKQEILNARKNKDTLGGIVEIMAANVPVGLGSHVHYDRKLDGRLAQALISIPSVKAVEIGTGIEISTKTGKQVQDKLYLRQSKKIVRETNNMGGIEGGISNGENIVCRVYHKPLSTIYDPLPTFDIKTGKPAVAQVERSDICVVARAGVISEAMVAFVLSQALLEKFGGDSILEIKRNFESYKKHMLLST